MAERKRELIDTGNDKRFVRRDAEGRFKEVVDVGASLAADQPPAFRDQGQVRPGRPRPAQAGTPARTGAELFTPRAPQPAPGATPSSSPQAGGGLESRRMEIGILRTGAPPGDLAERFGSYDAMFARLLGPGFEVRAYDVAARASCRRPPTPIPLS